VGVPRKFSEAEITPLEPDLDNACAGKRNIILIWTTINRSVAQERFFILNLWVHS